MSEKKRWIILWAVSLLVAVGLGTLIYLQQQKIEEWRTESETLRTEIASSRELIKGTPDLVKDVIVRRETDEVIKEILSDEEDVNNLVRTLQTFEEESGVSISSMKPQRETTREQKSEEFARVAYTLVLEADAFEFLSFLDQVEGHSRLMSVTAFKLASAGRNMMRGESDDVPRHKITLDLETYVYRPNTSAQEVRIDQYERKRESLIGEISKRTGELQLASYDFVGRRGRRDPWVDPRIPADATGQFLSIDQQIAIVDELIDLADAAEELWEQVAEADNLIAEMKARASLEEALAHLDEEARRVESAGFLTFVPASRRFQKKVVEVSVVLHNKLENTDGMQPGPSVAALQEAQESMRRHIEASEFELAQDVFRALEPRLVIAERDEFKQPFVQALYELDALVTTVLDFEQIELVISGIAIYEDRRPVVLINGSSVSEGELLGEDLLVRNIRTDYIEFDYRGVLLARPVEDTLNNLHSSETTLRGGN